MRPRTIAAGGLASVALVAGSLAWVTGDEGSAGGTEGGDDTTAAPRSTAEVATRDLAERAEVEGTLGYGETTEVTLGAGSADGGNGGNGGDGGDGGDGGSGSGTLTHLPDVGTVVEPGQTLVEVDGRPVPLLAGERPLWRPLGPGTPDGVDVQQLEVNLVALGVATADELTVDQAWTAATSDAVQEWQESLGLEETGTVAPGDLVFLPGAVRVVGHPTAVGGSASQPVLEVSGTSRTVTVDLDATRQTLVHADQAVEVELPDGTAIGGTVASVGTVASEPEESDEGLPPDDGGNGEATIEVVVTLDHPSEAGSFDEAPVTVLVVTSAAEGVLAVPVDALLALAEGGYAVEKVTSGGRTELVAVEIGAFADGWVEVTGDVAEGDDVAVPE
jgi:Putative peptidoglycan binding domain